MTTALLLSILAIVLLLFLSALFSGSETALTAASRARMHHLAREGDTRASTVNHLREQKDRLIGAILLGNNVVNIMASALATSVLIGLFGDAGVAYATLLMTALVLIFSEVLPKTYALNQPDRVALAVARPIGAVVWLAAPLVHLVQAIVRLTLKAFGIDVKSGSILVTAEEELRGALDLHAREGGIVKTDRDMLGSILDLSDLEVSDIMVHRRNMVMVDADQPVSVIIKEALSTPFTRVPLWRGESENIIGILHAKDLLRGVSQHEGELEELDLLALLRPPWFVPETTTLREQLNAFRSRHEHVALVVDEYGALMGLVTLEDILEEIVGEIADEHDVVAAKIRKEADGSYVVHGTVTIRDLNRHCDWELPDEDAATIAGLVIHQAREIPDVGAKFRFEGFTFEVLRRQRNQVTGLRIWPPGAMPPATA